MRAIKAKAAGTKPTKRRLRKPSAPRPSRKSSVAALPKYKNGTLADFWAKLDAIVAKVPKEAWKNVPSDLSHNHDHYLYGAPKR
jgi:hypothetical protein